MNQGVEYVVAAEDRQADEDTAVIDYMRQLAEMERDGTERAQLSVGPFTTMTMIGALQLATRHPGMTGRQRKLLRDVVRQLEPLFAGTPGEEIIRRGYHPEFDVEPDIELGGAG